MVPPWQTSTPTSSSKAGTFRFAAKKVFVRFIAHEAERTNVCDMWPVKGTVPQRRFSQAFVYQPNLPVNSLVMTLKPQ